MQLLAPVTSDSLVAIGGIVMATIVIAWFVKSSRKRLEQTNDANLDDKVRDLLCSDVARRFTLDDLAALAGCTAEEAEKSCLRLSQAKRVMREGLRWRCGDQGTENEKQIRGVPRNTSD